MRFLGDCSPPMPGSQSRSTVPKGIREPGGLRRVIAEGGVMLVLTRKVGERIVIGDGIVVTLVRIQGDKVRLGFEAPPSVVVLRGELKLREHQQGAPEYRLDTPAHS